MTAQDYLAVGILFWLVGWIAVFVWWFVTTQREYQHVGWLNAASRLVLIFWLWPLFALFIVYKRASESRAKEKIEK